VPLFTWDTISAVIAFNYGAFTYCGVVFQLLHLASSTDILLITLFPQPSF
jgi:hypothetical protein